MPIRGVRTALGLAVAVLLAVPAPAAAAAVPPAGASRSVVNGSLVTRPSRTVPWAISLYYSSTATSPRRFTCTATAIGPLEILTAAHCVDRTGFYYVRVGTDLVNRGRLVAIEAIGRHRNYRSWATRDDIAVLRPLARLDLRSYAKLATVTMAAQVRRGQLPALTMYGWGLTQHGQLTGHLRAASLRPETRAAKMAFGGLFVDSLMLGAGRVNPRTGMYSGACNGDSGGPLIAYRARVPYVVGVTSYRVPDCNIAAPTVFMSVGNYSAWIASARRGLPALAVAQNAAVPENLRKPAISGTVAAGATLTCDPGSWTSNARSFTYRWSRSTGNDEPVTTQHYQVTQQDSGARLTCTVRAASRAGAAVASASVTAGLAPAAVGGLQPIIGGVSPGVTPAAGTVATCTPPAFSPADAAVSTAWYLMVGGQRQLLASGASVGLSEETLQHYQGVELVCVATATNTMGTAEAAAAYLLPYR